MSKSLKNKDKLNNIVSVTDYGAKGDGVTDDRASIQSAIDAVYAAGGGTVVLPQPSVYYRIRLALKARSGVTVRVPNNATRIVCTGDGTGAAWPIYGIWVFGGTSGANYNRCTAYAANAIAADDEDVTLTTAGDSDNFAVGDVVSVESTDTYTVGTDVIPKWIQINVVTSSAAGVLGLRHRIDTTQSGVKVRQLTSDLFIQTAGGSDTEYELQAVRDFTIEGGTWETVVREAPWSGGGGLIDCAIKPHKVLAATGPAYGNLFANVTFESDVVIARRHAIELAFCSHGNTVRCSSITFDDTTIAPNWYIAMTEGARDNQVNVGYLNGRAFGSTANELGAIAVANSYRNRINVGTLLGSTLTKPVVSLGTYAYGGAGLYNDANDNDINIGYSYFESQVRYVGTSANVTRNRISGRFLGTVTNDALSILADGNTFDGYYENGAIVISGATENTYRGFMGTGRAHATDYPNIYSSRWEHETASYQQLRALSYILSPFTVDNDPASVKTTTFPANSLQTGDILKFRLRGVCAGAGGTKSLTVTFAGSTVLSLPAIGTGTLGIDVDIELYVSSATAVVGSATYIVGTTATTIDVALTGQDLTIANDFVRTIAATTGSDTFVVRQSRLNCIRPVVDPVVL